MTRRLLTIILNFAIVSQLVPNESIRTDYQPLAQTYPLENMANLLIPINEWHPFPTISNPAGLDKIPEAIRTAQIQLAEKQLEEEWVHFPATTFLDFVRNGNRSRYEHISFSRREKLGDFVLSELFERKGRFMDQIVNGIWAICEESFWGVPAHLYGQKADFGLPDVNDPFVDLFAAETGSLIAWIYYLLKPQLDEINPLIAERMVFETKRRIMTPYLEHEDWRYMGFTWRNRTGYMRPVNNWNPWINSNVLSCALLLEADHDLRQKLVFKCMDSLDNFVVPYPADGGCDEGPSYWTRAGGSLYDCLEILHSASGGKINVFDQQLIRNIGTYIRKVSISDPYYINFADASAKMEIEPTLVFRYGSAINDEQMKQFAAFAAKRQNTTQMPVHGRYGSLNRRLPALFTMNELEMTPAVQPFVRDVWFEDIQVMAARSFEGNDKSFYIAAKGGHNNESHNHNDIGNFIVYCDGEPVIIDAGAQTYTRKTFSSQRYELWNNQSAYHNLPTINGVKQKAGVEFKATNVNYKAESKNAVFALDIAQAYPASAKVHSWHRTVKLNRGENVEIEDEYELASFVEPFTLHLLTPMEAQSKSAGTIELLSPNGSYKVKYDEKLFEPRFERIDINDSRMSANWGKELFRIVFLSKSNSLQGNFKIIFEK